MYIHGEPSNNKIQFHLHKTIYPSKLMFVNASKVAPYFNFNYILPAFGH